MNIISRMHTPSWFAVVASSRPCRPANARTDLSSSPWVCSTFSPHWWRYCCCECPAHCQWNANAAPTAPAWLTAVVSLWTSLLCSATREYMTSFNQHPYLLCWTGSRWWGLTITYTPLILAMALGVPPVPTQQWVWCIKTVLEETF